MTTSVDFSSQAVPPTGHIPFSIRIGGDHRALATRCQDCGYTNFPPSQVCAQCMSLAVAPLPLSKTGVLYSYTTMRSGAGTVFVGCVDLPEKIRLFAELDGFSINRPPACGLPVTLDTIRCNASEERKPGPVFVFSLVATVGTIA